MKIVVIGGTGLIGSKLVGKLASAGHQAVAASPNSGVNTITGVGLAEALAGAQVVVDVANSPSFKDDDVLSFFQTSSRNLLAAAAAAGVVHHIALSVVGAERLPDSGYMRAKIAQEELIQAGPVPWTILRATQFFEFLAGIANAGTQDGTVHLSSAFVQPIAADDVASALAELAVAAPQRAILEVAGQDRIRLDEIVTRYLAAIGDPRRVVGDAHARYFGAELTDETLTPGDKPILGPTRFAAWLERTA
jgi:uncharacterized protein YbjT (DUF2867 family)